MMKKLIVGFLFTFFIGIAPSWSQMDFSYMVQPNEIAKNEVNQLYFIDFWATWCAPCIHVSKYLTVLQKQYPDSFYIISLTEEQPETIIKFLKKHQTQLAVAIDYNGKTFYKNNVRSLPYGMLINANGTIVWQGHPADLKANMLSKFLRQNTKKASIEDVFKFHKTKNDNDTFITYKPSKDFECKALTSKNDEHLKIAQNEEYIKLTGKLSEILAFAYSVHNSQIQIDDSIDNVYEMYFKKESIQDKAMSFFILKEFQLALKEDYITKNTLVLSSKNHNFWDTRQLEFENYKRYDIGEMDFKANDISLSEFKYMLSKLLEKPIVLRDFNDDDLHDWQLHYKFYDLMQSDLLNTYGIDVSQNETEVVHYIFTKKAP